MLRHASSIPRKVLESKQGFTLARLLKVDMMIKFRQTPKSYSWCNFHWKINMHVLLMYTYVCANLYNCIQSKKFVLTQKRDCQSKNNRNYASYYLLFMWQKLLWMKQCFQCDVWLLSLSAVVYIMYSDESVDFFLWNLYALDQRKRLPQPMYLNIYT